MAKYKNGQIPANLLVRRGKISLTAGTWAKWDALVADVKARHGVTLTITQGSGVTTGSGGYRDLAMQRAVKQKYIELGKPNQAATEGASSHGGEYKGRDAMAVDVNNYWAIPRAEFFAAARRAGFTPNVFDGRGGRPLEPWHLIDYDPYRKVEDDMTPEQAAQLKVIYDSIRFGEKGVRTHGALTGAIMSEIGAQKIFRATHGQSQRIDVAALADAIAEQLDPIDAEDLARTILRAQGKALTEATG